MNIKFEITPKIDGSRIFLITEIANQVTKTVLATQDKCVRDALIALGWTPPRVWDKTDRGATCGTLSIRAGVRDWILSGLPGGEVHLDAFSLDAAIKLAEEYLKKGHQVAP